MRDLFNIDILEQEEGLSLDSTTIRKSHLKSLDRIHYLLFLQYISRAVVQYAFRNTKHIPAPVLTYNRYNKTILVNV